MPFTIKFSGNADNFDSADDPFGRMIEASLVGELPGFTSTRVESVLEAVTSQLLGTRQLRLGPLPTPEALVLIRGRIRESISRNHPIPILVPSGPKKPVPGQSIDIAELAAIKVLVELDRRVKQHFSPGLVIVIRLEDLTGLWLEGEGAKADIERYTADFVQLSHLLGPEILRPVRESDLAMPKTFHTECLEVLPIMMDALQETAAYPNDAENYKGLAFEKLKSLGWQGLLDNELRVYLHARYLKLYPSLTHEERNQLLAKYLTSALVRRRIHATGASHVKDYGPPIDLTFMAPPPGNYNRCRLYYRQIPMCQSKLHMPYWRARGLLKINGSVRMCLASWQDELDTQEGHLHFTGLGGAVEVRADYLLED